MYIWCDVCELAVHVFVVVIQQTLSSTGYPPCSQRQGLNPHHRGFDVAPERDYTDYNTQDIDNVISIGRHLVNAATVPASVLVCFTSTSKGLSDSCTFQEINLGWCRRWEACRCGEHIDSFENKVARECTTKVRDSVVMLAEDQEDGRSVDSRSKKRHVSSTDERVRDLSMEGTDCDKHDRVHESREHMLSNDE
jgi:hypothetical protein